MASNSDPPRRVLHSTSGQPHSPCWFTIPELLTPSECTALIAKAMKLGFEPAPSRGTVLMPEVRNGERTFFEDGLLAQLLWSRLQPRMPAIESGLLWEGMDPEFRVYRYSKGHSP